MLTGEGGLLADPDDVPRIVVDCSTVDQAASEAMRAACDERGVAFLAAPVSGNGKVVRAGMLTLVASGPEETFRQVRPLLEHIGKSVTYVGEGDVARLVKICHNLMLGVVTQTMAEITVLAEKGGVSRDGVPLLPQRQRHGLGLHPLQDAGVREPGLHADVHADPAAQGLRPRPAGRPRPRRPDAASPPRRRRRCRPASAAAGSTRTSRSCSTCRRRTPGSTLEPENKPVDDGLARGRPGGGAMTAGRPLPAPGHMGVDYESGSTSTGCRRYRLEPGEGVAGGQRRAAPSCCSTSTTSATPRRPGSAVRSATR